MKSTSDEVDYSDACAFDPHDPEIREACAGWTATFDDERENDDG